ncbi:L,D-transpeptidase family protein [Desertivirga brevis]|uniref:L,D-transpeptidase family protein n=1 Tax=Desertivirga brevis TaxID=2810310 RepID=UPI001A9596C3|nr:L,D-transpeptidase family protein [Pedobacter sp. SYSU D00873]
MINKTRRANFFLIFLLVLGLAVTYYYSYPEEKIKRGVIIDKILVLKAKRKLLVYSNGTLVKSYTIALGRSPIGDKQFEGDNKTPEGIYKIYAKNPRSGWHKNLGISYPNLEDRRQAKPLNKSPGGEIKIHGLKNGRGFIGRFHRWKDWTQGCIALTNEEVDEIYEHTPIGTTIEIRQ